MVSCPKFHPAVPVTAGCIFILLVQQVRWPWQTLWLTGLVIACLLRSRREWLRVMRRLRYLLLVLLILFAWQTPGELVWPSLGALSPSLDGCRLAAESATRIVCVASIVALMLHALSPREWVGGLFSLAYSLKFLGAAPERFAVRLQLVLDEAGRAEKRPWRYWLDDDARLVDGQGAWQAEPLLGRDRLALLAIVLAYAGWVWVLR